MALFINDIVDELDISSIEGYYEKGIKGYPPYHPRMMLKVLTYAHCTWVRSSRKVAKKIEEDVAYRFLTGVACPSAGRYRSLVLRLLGLPVSLRGY